jgi:glutathionylspermidine synthase
MKRSDFKPRENWQARCEEEGFNFYSLNGKPYWREDAGYGFSLAEIEKIEDATSDLHSMCMDHVSEVVRTGDYAGYDFPDWVKKQIENSWIKKDPHLYGRFDLVFGNGQVKMLEYNADTPTSLLESAVIQWTWIQDRDLPDQFNSIHDKLVERWKQILEHLPVDTHFYLAAMQDAGLEDWGNLNYLAETLVQTDNNCSLISIEDIGWDEGKGFFVDIEGRPIVACFKLYPWEWIIKDEFGAVIPNSFTQFIEPAWKMLLSNKAILPLLWKKHKDHPWLLPAYFDTDDLRPKQGEWVRKPLLAREGSNISLLKNGRKEEFSGAGYNPAYEGPGVMQLKADLPDFNGWHPIIGSWVIGDNPAGMGIREDKNNVTGNDSWFVPHYFEE